MSDRSEVPAYPSMLQLEGRGMIVLGAGQGIGRQTAHALSACGARVICVDVEPERAEQVAQEIGGVPWTGDLTDPTTLERLGEEAEDELGRIDGVVDIIGMARYGPTLESSEEDWEWTFDMVLRHAVRAARVFGIRMEQSGGGTLAYIASVSGITGAAGHAAYGAAKAALMSLVRSLAVELGPAQIRVNAVAPGVVWTPRVAELLGEEAKEIHADNTPLRRVALPADIASVLLFLSSPLSAYVNGQVIVTDGGVGSKFPYPVLW